MIPYVTKLIDVTEKYSKEISKQWYANVRKNPRTPAYHKMTEEQAIPQALEFYSNFRELFMSDKPFETATKFFSRYAEDRYYERIPLQEAIYALVMMRRHMWLYAEFQAIFVTAVEHQQAVSGLNRTILMFDYATYVITERYQSLMRSEVDDKLRAIGVIGLEGPMQKYKPAIMAALLLAAGFITYYYHAVLHTSVIFTHLFYIPIALGAIWFRKKGVGIALLLGVFLLISNWVFLKGPVADDLIRAIMFVVIASIIAILTEGITKLCTPFVKEAA